MMKPPAAMPACYRNRLSRLRELLPQNRLSGLLVTSPENRRYLSGYRPADPQLNESSGFLLVGPDTAIIGTDPRYEVEAREEARGFSPFIYDRGLEGSWDKISSEVNKMSRLAFETSSLTYQLFLRFRKLLRKFDKDVRLVPSENLVESLRVCKTPEEIRAIRRSLKITEDVFQEIYRTLRPGQTEKALAWKIKDLIHQKGGEGIAFEPIVASGPNAGRVHAEPTDRPIRKGEPIIFDFGAKWNGYCSDLSRTVCLGRPPDRFRELYGLVKEAQTKAQEGLRSGLTTREADRLAREVIDRGGCGRLFKHSLGHGVGLATHELPSLSPIRPIPLQSGMVITVEPGVYLPDWGGIRLENMVVIRQNRGEVLNQDRTFYAF